MTQNKLDPELLISLIEHRPVIWDKTLKKYKDKNLRLAAWRDVCITLKEDFEEMEEKEKQKYAKAVVNKWNQIRDSWLRSLNANKKSKKSGSALVTVKKYCYHNQLLFLKKNVKPLEKYDSANNTEINQDTTDSEDGGMYNYDTINEEMKHKPSVVNESLKQENFISGVKRFKRRDVPRQFNKIDQEIMSYIDYQMKIQNNSQNEDRNLSFFKSLLPSLALLNDDQILQFQGSVIKLLQNIKSGNYNE